MGGHVTPYLRTPFFHERGPGVGVDKSLQERIDDIYQKENREDRVDIGFKKVGAESAADKNIISKWRKENRKNRELEKAAREGTLQVDLEKVRDEWKKSGDLYEEIYKSAELYGLYEDLFRHGYFYPCVELDAAYAQADDVMVPVYRGNIVKPGEAAVAPEVTWPSQDDDLWCLVMTGPDTHLTEEGQEYLHWMVGNIKGSDISTGDELASYLQPFPPFGTGYHRYAFILYKQEGRIDLSSELRTKATDLQERTFNTFSFYSRFQDALTPAGLSFFQSDYETSLRDFFHNVLNMKEPRYEYEFPLPYMKQWNMFGPRVRDTGFNEYMDKHRDPKDIEKEVLIKKLAHTHPFFGDTEAFIRYPEAHEADLLEVLPAPVGQKPLNPRQSYKIPSWRRNAIMKEKAKHGYYSSTDHSELRRDPQLSQ